MSRYWRLAGDRINGNLLAVFVDALKLHHTGNSCEKRVVFGAQYVRAWVKNRAALAYDN